MKEKTKIKVSLKKISIISMCICVIFLFISVFCIYFGSAHILAIITWSIFGISLSITIGVSIVRGVTEVKQKLIK